MSRHQPVRKKSPERIDEQAWDHPPIAPADADSGILGEAVKAGNYQAFRSALVPYEEWLRKRAGRWIQRYPEAEAKLGQGLAIGDLVEEVYLVAFEHYPHWPREVPFHEWLDSLNDPALR